jgi:hypothetical protein
MQDSVGKTILIIKDFISEARVERALLIANIILLLVSGSKISLYQLGISIKNNHSTKLKSAEQKVRRLLENFPITSKTYAKAVIALFAVTSVELIIDRTNWMFGITDINFLVLSLRWHNIAIPIYWIMLNNNGGNSNSDNELNWLSGSLIISKPSLLRTFMQIASSHQLSLSHG